MYVREGLGKPWYESLLDVAGEAGAAVAEAYGGKMAGDGVRAGHKIWTSLAFKDKGGGSHPAPAPPRPRPVPPPRRPVPHPMVAKRYIPFRPPPNTPSFRPSPSAAMPNVPMQRAGMFGGGSSKGLVIFGVVSAAAIGIYLMTRPKGHVSR